MWNSFINCMCVYRNLLKLNWWWNIEISKLLLYRYQKSWIDLDISLRALWDILDIDNIDMRFSLICPSLVITQNDRLLLAHTNANLWAKHPLILKSWIWKFLLLPSVSQDFGASGPRHVPSASTTIYYPMDCSLGWGGLVFCFVEIWDVLFQSFLHSFCLVSKHKILLKAPFIFSHEYSFLQRW